MRVKPLFLLIIGLLIWLVPPASVRSMPAGQPGEKVVAGEVVVGMKEGVHAANLRLPEGVTVLRASRELDALRAVVVRVPPGYEGEYAQKLRRASGVLFAEPNYIVRADMIPNDPLWAQQYAPVLIQAPAAWDVTTGSSAVIVAVIDSGIDAGHPEFDGRLLPGYDFVEKDDSPQDECGHGTHVAGILAAEGNNAAGVAGIAWNARILPVRVLDRRCYGSVARVAEALVWAVERGARVINLSLGTATPSTLMENATYYAYRQGAALFAASGNSGANMVMYPARYDWVMAVGAVDAAAQRASFSNYGPALDLMAPGVDILSTTPYGAFYYQTLFGTTSQYGLLSGTSMAAPHAAGAAALLASLPAFDQPDKIYQALTATALDLEAPGRDDNTGYGLLQLANALAFTPGTFPPPPTPAIEYDLADSDTCSNLVQYQWRDAAAAGTAHLFLPGTNEGYAAISLPFDVTFGGQTYTSVTAHSNGYLALGHNPATIPDNFIIPGIAQPNDFIAAFWDNLTADTNGVLYTATLGSAPTREFVIEWTEMKMVGMGTSLLRFEVVLFEDRDDVLIQYHTLNGNNADGASATVGVEYAAGQAGREYAYNRAGALWPGLALLFRPYPTGGIPPSSACENFTARVDTGGGFFDAPPFCALIPADALQHPATLQIIPLLSAPPMPRAFLDLGHYADIRLLWSPAPPLSPVPEVYVCYHYTPQDVLAAGGHPENLFIAAYDQAAGRWQALPTSADLLQEIIMARAPHFSIYGVGSLKSPADLPQTGAPLSPKALAGLAGLAGLLWVGWRWQRK